MSEFGGLWKHEKTQRALVGLGSAALSGCCSLTQVRQPKFPTQISHSGLICLRQLSPLDQLALKKQ